MSAYILSKVRLQSSHALTAGGGLRWEFMDGWPGRKPRVVFSLHYSKKLRVFTAHRRVVKDGRVGPPEIATREELDHLRSLLPPQELARCAAASIMRSMGISA